MANLFVLFEHATGYALFKVMEFEEICMFLPKLESAVNDISRFQSLVKLVDFSQFNSSASALENINAISEGILLEQLQTFLDTTIPKKRTPQLGVLDPKLCAAITEALNLPCTHVGAVPELIRGIRSHFPHLVRKKLCSITDRAAGIAQLGLGHAYSRAQVKFNVNRVDNMIIQSISLLDQLDKNVNSFYMRIREWYSYHYPELVQLVPDAVRYSRAVKVVQDKKTLNEAKREELKKIGLDADAVNAIFDAARCSLGMDINPIDMLNISRFASRVVSLAEYRNTLTQYLHNKISIIAPNLATLVGDTLGARLISRAGSLTNLAKMPASTVQILGSEKALFRALKTHGNTPKYGVLYNSSYIGRAGQYKGRISRYLAAKCSIVARIDCFSDHVNTFAYNVYGRKLRQQVEDRLHFYETGHVIKKNCIAMQEAKQEIETLQQAQEEVQNQRENETRKNDEAKTKTKRKYKEVTIANDDYETDIPMQPKKKKNKKQNNKIQI